MIKRVADLSAPLLGVGAFFAAFLLINLVMLQLNRLHIDEIYTLVASDPRKSYFYLLSRWMLPETNPPGHSSLLYLFRIFISDNRIAFISLNVSSLAITIIYVWRKSLNLCSADALLVFFAFFLSSGTSLLFFQEGRAIFASMCMVTSIWWYSFSILSDESEPSLSAVLEPALLGLLASQLHVYAALFAGAVAACIVTVGFFQNKWALFRRGLLLGSSAVVSFAFWWPHAADQLHHVSWIVFSLESLRYTLSMLKSLTLGPGFITYALILPIALFLVFAAKCFAKRSNVFWVFSAVCFIVVLLPMLISLFQPIVFWRYWAIYMPLIIGQIAFFAYTILIGDYRLRPEATTPLYRGIACACIGAVALGSSLSVPFVLRQVQDKLSMPGIEHAELMRYCPLRSIRVYPTHGLLGLEKFSVGSGVSVDRFAAPSDAIQYLDRDLHPLCRVAGWVDMFSHVTTPQDLTDKQVYALIDIPDSDPSGKNFHVIRYWNGFLIVRR